MNKQEMSQISTGIDEILKKAREKQLAADKKRIVDGIGKDLTKVLGPLMIQIAKRSQYNKKELKEILKSAIKESVSVRDKQIVVQPKINVPPVMIPDIHVPHISVPKPEVSVTVPAPKVHDVTVKGLKGFIDGILKTLRGVLNIKISAIDHQTLRDSPLPVIFVDEKGRYQNIGGGSSSIIGTGGGPRFVEIKASQGNGDGTKTLTTAGTRECLVSESTLCKRVFIQAHEDNAGTMVIGGTNVVGAKSGRRGFALFPTQGDWFNVNDLSRLWIDGTNNGDKVNYYYEV